MARAKQGAASLSAGQFADAAIAQVGKVNGGQGGGGGFTVGAAVGAKEAARGGETHHGYVPDSYGEIPIDLLQLGNEADLLTHFGAGATMDGDPAPVGFHQPDDGFQQGGFTAPVGANHSGEAAAVNGE